MFVDNVLLSVVIIFVVRVASIAVSTVRFLLMGRSNAILVSTLAFFEALAFALTFGAVASNLDNIPNLVSYCMGFAVGTWVGTLIEARVGNGFASVNIISKASSLPIVEAIRSAGYGATRTSGEGGMGTVGLVWAVVRRKDAPRVVTMAQEIDEDAFITVNEARSVMRGFINYGRR